jgi:hypothetical protein
MNEDSGVSPVALALAELRGAVDTGFAKMEGRLEVGSQRTFALEMEIKELKRKYSALEAKLWKFSMAAALIGGAGGAGAYQLV